MSESVGSIQLDLGLDTAGFKQQINGIGSTCTGTLVPALKKVGAAAAIAFSVKKVAGFASSCISLGSDLSEVENVVSTVFPHMVSKYDEFAKSAASTFGLSETMAKRFMGTFGAMSESFGFTESAAYDMSKQLTSLSGDVASFYNISQDEAYTKLKSVFTGETESLKELGVVMTEAALNQYAMQNGISRTVNQMSEQEKVSLRLAFVTDKLKLAAGDFSKTSGSWANQTRLLSLQFDSLKASIGQGLIAVLTPCIKLLNSLIAKIAVAADFFKQLMQGIFGTGSASTQASGDAAKAAAEATNATDALASSTGGIGGAANDSAKQADKAAKKIKKSAKEAQRSMLSFDKANKLNDNSSSDDSSSPSSGGVGGGTGVSTPSLGLDTSGLDASTSKVTTEVQKMIEAIKKELGKLKASFKVGFFDGLGKSFKTNVKSIKTGIKDIKSALNTIFSDGKVLKAAELWAGKVAFALGQVTGSVVSIGSTIAANLIGGLGKSLNETAPSIKKFLIDMFDITGDTALIVGKFSTVLADILSVFGSEDAQQITADIITLFTNAFIDVGTVALKFGRDVVKAITDPIVKNKDAIKNALTNTIKPVKTVVSGLKKMFKQVGTSLKSVYDKYIGPAIQNISDGFSNIFGALLSTYNKDFAPVIQNIATKLSTLLTSSIGPMVSSVLTLIGKLASAIGSIWKVTLAPLLSYLVQTFGPLFAAGFQAIADMTTPIIGGICGVIKGIIDAASGVVDFIAGVFTGDWKKAWKGVKAAVVSVFKAAWSAIKGVWGAAGGFFKNLWATIKSIFKPVASVLGGFFTAAWKAIKGAWGTAKSFFKTLWDGIKGIFNSAATWFGKIFGLAWSAVKTAWSSTKTFFGGIWTGIKGCFSSVTTWFGTKFSSAWTAVKNAWSSTKSFFSGVWTGIKGCFSSTVTWFGSKFSSAWSSVKSAWSNTKKFFSGIWSGIKSVFSGVKGWFGGVFEGAKNAAVKAFSGVGSALKAPFRSIANLWNKTVGKINFTVPDWVPGIGGKHWGMPKIPELAKGGYVKANTPQLAMIGDNRHQGEVVAPEDKLLSMAKQAAELAGGNSDLGPIIQLLNKIIDMLATLSADIYLDKVKVTKEIVDEINKQSRGKNKSIIWA